MRMKCVSLIFPMFLSSLFVGISTTGAHAYLDAGTGSMILQVLLGGVAGLAIAGKLYWHKFLVMIGVRSKVELEDDDELSATQQAKADR